MKTTLYLIRHAATEGNLVEPERLHGRRHNPPLGRLGVRQAELTRDFLAVRPIDYCYCSPMLHAIQTASIIAAPHGLSPTPLEDLLECDIGTWEGLDWPAIRYLDADGYRRYLAAPDKFAYPNGESFAAAQGRITAVLEDLLRRHAGHGILVVAHDLAHRIYLAGLLGVPYDQALQLKVDPCGISVIVREDEQTTVTTLNAAFHLHGLAA
jgi:broad specificity phosphatase PhoE